MSSNPAEKDSIGKALGRLANPGHIGSLVQRSAACVKQRGWQALGRELHFRVALATGGEVWRRRADIPLQKELRAQRAVQFAQMPCVSIVVPLYNTPVKFFKQLLHSVQSQSYPVWQLVLADAGATNALQSVATALQDERIVYTKLAKNGGIANNTNAGLALATGEYITLLDHDDVLQPNALYEMVKAVNETGADFLYSDEVVLSADLKKLLQYHFKPDFGPDILRSGNYITHLSVFSRALLQQAGGTENAGFDGAQDFDLILRLTEKAKKIHHVPLVLYFWRGADGSTAAGMDAKKYAISAGAAAVNAHLQRVGLAGAAQPIPGCPGAYRTRYTVQGRPSVCVIIPSKDHTDDLRRCLNSLYANAGYDNFSVLVVENNSTQAETFAFYQEAEKTYPNLSVLQYTGGFNFSAVCNVGVQHTAADHVLLLNNDIEIAGSDFIREMLSFSQRADVGAVGAKLLYPDNTIQHAGVIIGINGSAGHSHKGHPAQNTGDMYRLAAVQNYSAVTGAALMTKRSLYNALGGLDEQHFAVAYNDVDYCLRLRAEGYNIVMTPFATAIHYESKSRGSDTAGGQRQARYEKEKAAFAAKWHGYFEQGDAYYNPHFTYLYENYGYK